MDGFLDLNEWDSYTQDILGVSGTWEVYAGELIPPQQFTDRMWFAQPDAYLPLNQYRDASIKSVHAKQVDSL